MMREHVSRRNLIVVIVAAAVVASGWTAVHAFQGRRNARHFPDIAQRAKGEGRPDRAAKFLQLYLARHPDDAGAYAEYADVLTSMARSAQARRDLLPVYREVLQRDPDNHEVRRRFVRVALGVGSLDAALEQLVYLRKAFPDDAELQETQGDCLVQREPAEAAKVYRDLVKRHPRRVAAYAKLARVLAGSLNRKAEADACMGELIRQNGASPDAFLARAMYFKSGSRGGDAVKDINKALELAPARPDIVFFAAEMLRYAHDGNAASRRHLLKLLEADPKQKEAYEWLARLELDDHKSAEARGWLERGLKELPSDADLLWNLAQLLIAPADQGGDLGRARTAMRKIDKDKLGPGRMGFLEASLGVQEGRWQAALKALEIVRPLLASTPALVHQTDLLRAQCYERLGNGVKALNLYTQVVSADPLSVAARYGCVTASLQTGRLGSALEQCRVMMQMPRVPKDGWLLLARLSLIEMLERAEPARKWAEIGDLLDKAAKAVPDSPGVAVLRAEVLFARNDKPAAQRLLEESWAKTPKERIYPITLAELLSQTGQPGDALAVLDRADRQMGDLVELRLARGRILVRRGGKDSSESISRLTRGADRFPVPERIQLLNGVAEMFRLLGKLAEAEGMWKQVATLAPTDLVPRLALFDAAYVIGTPEAMREALEGIREIEGAAGPFSRYDQARLAIWRASKGESADLLEARSLLTQVGRDLPEWPRVPLALAEIDELEKKPDSAVDNYRRAIGLGEKQVGVFGRLVELLYERKRYAEAEVVLRQLPRQQPLGESMQRLAAQVSLQMNEPGRALDYARNAVSKDSTKPEDQRWLGRISWAAQNLADAEAAFRRAVKLAPADAESRVALVQFLATTGKTENAEGEVRAARKALGAGSELALAQCYLAVNQREQARKLYEAAKLQRPDDVIVLESCADFYLRIDDIRRSEECLRKLKRNVKDPAAARRAGNLLSVILATRGDPQKSKEALSLLGLQGKDLGAIPEGMDAGELRSRAAVLASQPGRSRARQALQTLEALDRLQKLTAEERFLRVQMLDRLGDKARLRAELQKLLASDGENPRFLAYQVRLLLRQGIKGEAERWLDALETAAPKAIPLTTDLRVRLFKAQGQEGEAAKLVRERLKPKEPAELLAAAELLEGAGLSGEAEGYFRKYAVDDKSSARTLVLARFLGRRGKLSEALALCDEAWKTCPPVQVAYALLSVFHSDAGTAAQRERVRRQIGAALAKDPTQMGLRVCLAALANLDGKYEEARNQYQSILDDDPRNAEALNNLAWLLSFVEGSGEKVVELATQAAEELRPIPEVLDTRALGYLASGKPDKAMEDLEEAEGSSVSQQTLASIKLHMAVALSRQGKLRESAQQFKEAKAAGLTRKGLHPLERPTWDMLGGAK